MRSSKIKINCKNVVKSPKKKIARAPRIPKCLAAVVPVLAHTDRVLSHRDQAFQFQDSSVGYGRITYQDPLGFETHTRKNAVKARKNNNFEKLINARIMNVLIWRVGTPGSAWWGVWPVFERQKGSRLPQEKPKSAGIRKKMAKNMKNSLPIRVSMVEHVDW